MQSRKFWFRRQSAFLNLRILQLPDFERRACSVTPLVFLITGGMKRERSMFVKLLCQLVPTKRKEKFSLVTYVIRCKISYASLRNSLICVRRSRKVSREYDQSNAITFSIIDFAKNNEN